MIVLNNLFIPENLKRELREPLGKAVESIDKIVIDSDKKLITIGDKISSIAVKAGLNPIMMIYDCKEYGIVAGKEIVDVLENSINSKVVVNNPKNCISDDLQKTIKKSMDMGLKVKIFIIGEDTFAFIPAIMEADDNTIVLYGTRNSEILMVEVNDNVKNKCMELVNKMETKGL